MLALALLAAAQVAPDIVIDDVVPVDDGDDFVDVPFEVPAGTAEIEIHQDRVNGDDVLDFSLEDPGGFRGEGGSRIHTVILNADAATRSYLPGPVTPGTWTLCVGEAALVSDEPRYHVEIFFRTETTLPPATDRAPYVASAPLSDERRYYAGDFHVHSEDSNDARPPLDEIAEFAHGEGLDFVVVSDHNTTAHIDRIVAAQERHPELLFVPGVEFTTYRGHATGFGATQLVDWRVGHHGVTFQDALDGFAAQGALVSINHPMLEVGIACIGCGWHHDLGALDDNGALAGVEIETAGYHQAGFLYFADAVAFWEALLDDGKHLAAIGGSDDHQAGQSEGSRIGAPTTLVFADGLSVEALKDGIRASRTVVKLQGPGDPMIELETKPQRVGDLAIAPEVTLSAKVTGARGMHFTWVTAGSYDAALDVTEDPQTFTLRVPAPAQGETRVRGEVADDEDPRTITSYVWIASDPRADEGDPNCTCTSGSGADLALLSASAALLCARRRARRSPAGA